MILTPLDWSLDNQEVSIDGNVARSEGVHVSQIIHSLETKFGRLKGRTDLGDDSEALWHDYRTAGFLIERVFHDLLVEQGLIKIGEMCIDNIYLTPDFLNPAEWLIEEWKCTWRSAGHDIEEMFVAWWMQIKAYCYAVGCTKARLRVFFVNGDYHPRKPKLMAWEAEFTPQELEDNWMMLVNHAKSEGWLQ